MTPLAALLRDRIRAAGPITVAEYMAEALGHPEHGYYRKKDPLGAAGDFVTAPEISQMFGEIIGLWCVAVWQTMGAPNPFNLVELGPGRGTLMADLLRAARLMPDFGAAADVHLVETSLPLRRAQRAALGDRRVRWHDAFSEVPRAPTLLIANEFFDALPIRQFEHVGGDWHERLIDHGDDGFEFVTGPPVPPDVVPAGLRAAQDGAVAESCPAGCALAAEIGRHVAGDGGAALVIDYGPSRSGHGDSLQAVRGHRYQPPLAAPGEADLTAHVDFQALAEAAAPAVSHGPVDQGLWLRRLGIEVRTATLARANPAKAAEIAVACRRLIAPSEMGTLFKVLALAEPSLPVLPGFAAEQGLG